MHIFISLLLLFSFVINSKTFDYPIEQKCVSYGNFLSKISTKFIECAFNNSRPSNICKNCVQYYLEFRDLYNLMKNDTTQYAETLYENGLVCRDIIEARDRMQYNFQIFDLIFKIWDDSNCNSCFKSYSLDNGHVNYTISDNFQTFLDLHNQLGLCIYNETERILPIDPLFDIYSPNTTLCQQCKYAYTNLTQFFNDNIKENEFCMDVVDTFNYTRIVWSKGYKCNYRDPDPILFKVICGISTLITILFYTTVKVFGIKEEKQFVPIFRKRTSVFFHALHT